MCAGRAGRELTKSQLQGEVQILLGHPRGIWTSRRTFYFWSLTRNNSPQKLQLRTVGLYHYRRSPTTRRGAKNRSSTFRNRMVPVALRGFDE